MRVSIGLVSTLAVGCLLVACSGTDGSRDSGPSTPADGGPKDAGPKDGGPTGGEVGENCINNNSGQLEQSTCTTGLLCLPLSQENTTLTVCSKDCAADADCGIGKNGVANICWSGICWQGCGTTGGNCNQPDFNCQGFSQTASICLPDCTQQAKSFCTEFFGYPFIVCDDGTGANASLGSCGTAGGTTCGPTMACTGSGEACYPIPGRNGAPSTQSVCVDDCTQAAATTCRNNTECESDSCVSGHCAPCQGGYACSASLKTCQIIPQPNYGPCTFTAQCPSMTNCINFGNGQGLCLPPCTTDQQCPAGGTATPKCALDLNDGSKVCALDCSASGSVCPTDTACAAIQGLGSFCFPSPGSNPADAGPADAGPADAGSL